MVAPSAAADDAFRDWWNRSGNRAASPATAKAILDVILRADVRQALPLIRVPTLILHRRDDRFIPSRHGRYLATHIDGAKYVELAFTATNPSKPMEVQWVVHQRMADGTMLNWSDKPGAHGKASTTKILTPPAAPVPPAK